MRCRLPACPSPPTCWPGLSLDIVAPSRSACNSPCLVLHHSEALRCYPGQNLLIRLIQPMSCTWFCHLYWVLCSPVHAGPHFDAPLWDLWDVGFPVLQGSPKNLKSSGISWSSWLCRVRHLTPVGATRTMKGCYAGKSKLWTSLVYLTPPARSWSHGWIETVSLKEQFPILIWFIKVGVD